MGAARKTIIEARDLTIGYDGRVVLSKLNFSILEGEVFVILGGSGCGKSTVLKHLIGLNRPMDGDILIDGRSIVKSSPGETEAASRKFGVLYQSAALFSSLTLEENVSLPLREFTSLSAPLIAAIAKTKLSMVGLGGFDNFMPSEISGGMKKRAGLARALALDPKILFLDEPSAGLDPISSAELDKLILELRRELGCTVVIVTHELDSIFTVADRAIILSRESKGIIGEGEPKKLRESSENPWIRNFLNRSNLRG